jgi:hypothetical protein
VRETGKTRAQRIQLDYFRRADGIRTLRKYAILFAGVAATCYGVFALSGLGASHLSTGPISNAHRAYENDCSQCHGTSLGSGISRDAWHPWPQDRLEVLEQACQECHPVAGHFRESLKNPALDRDCASCHREHLGREHQPGMVADESCVKCHADLKDVLLFADSQLKNSIAQFSLDGHGDFRSLEKDTGKVFFDHAQHMRPGQVEDGQLGGFEYGMFEASWRKVYQKSGDVEATALVELSCDDCHEPYGQASVALLSAHGKEHAVGFNPIRFDHHCSGCHALNFYDRDKDEQLPLPHAVPWKELRSLLRAKVMAKRMDQKILSVSERADAKPLPPDRPGTSQENNDKDQDLSESELSSVLQSVRFRCLKCHSEADITPEAIERKGEVEYIPPARLKHGHFDHAAHDHMNCQYCHPGTLQRPNGREQGASQENTGLKPPTDHQTLMIRGIASCVECHGAEAARDASQSPSRSSQREGEDSATLFPDELLGRQPRQSSSDCIFCHRYHWTRMASPPTPGTVGGMELGNDGGAR